MRPEKANIVSDLSEKLKGSPFLLVADYQRMKVDQFSELRNRLAPAGAQIRVVKNSFLIRAMSDSGMPDVADKLAGQTAVVTGENDVAPVAKILKAFATEFKIAALKIGVVDKEVMSSSDVEALADLPAREVLLAQFLALLQTPATQLVRVLNEPASAFARLMKAKADKGDASGEKKAEPAAEAPVAEATAETPATAPEEVKPEEAPAAEVAAPAAEEPAAPESAAPADEKPES